MYQAIPENLSQILLKRLIMLPCIVLVAIPMIKLYKASFAARYPTVESSNTFSIINKTDIVFTSFNLR